MRFSRALLLDLFLIFVVTAASSAVAYHNVLFSSPFDSPDIRAHQQNAVEWIRNGVIPVRGQGTSYSGVGTPGTTFLLLPGVLLFSDWRLQEIPGAILLHFGTLLFLSYFEELAWERRGAYRCCRCRFNPLTGPTLWPNGHPFFVVGALYCLIRWARDREGWGLPVALFLLAAGIYVYPTIAPAVFAIPVVWIIYRPPVSWKALMISIVLAAILWAPFLFYEAGKGFSDITSMLLRKDVSGEAANVPVYCFAARIGEPDQVQNIYVPYLAGSDPARVAYPGGGVMQSAGYHTCVFLMHIDQNFDAGWFLLPTSEFANRVLYGVFVLGLFALLGAAWRGPWARWPFWRVAVPLGIGGAMAFWAIIQPDIFAGWLARDDPARSNLRLVFEQLHIIVPLVWCGFLLGMSAGAKSNIDRRAAGVAFVCILFSFVLLAVFAEPDRPWRFWWLWPLQTTGLVAGVVCFASVLPARVWMERIFLISLAVFTFPLAHVQAAIQDVQKDGFGGRDSGQIAVLAYLAEAAKERQTDMLSVGVMRFQADGDPTRPGGWLDFGMHYSYGIENRNADGPVAGDDFRLEDFRQGIPADAPPQCAWAGWRIVFQSARLILCAPEDQ